MVTSDAREALFRCNHLGSVSRCQVASCIPFPFSALCNVMLTMIVCATRWLSMHLYTLAYTSMHKSCLLVCHPCFNTMKLWIFDPNLHLSLVNTTFCFLSCLFVCYPFCFFACILFSFLVVLIMIIYFIPLCYALCIFSLHRLFASFLSLPSHVHIWSEDARS